MMPHPLKEYLGVRCVTSIEMISTKASERVITHFCLDFSEIAK
jgi:hypothetical protein